MTTIAYRNGILAADGQAMNGEWIQTGSVRKLHRLSNGSVCGVTGEFTKGLSFLNWLDGDRENPRPEMGDAWRVIELQSDGTLLVHEAGGTFEPDIEFCAWGSGAPPANAAMIMGADATRAVEVAAMIDPNTGGSVCSMKAGNAED